LYALQCSVTTPNNPLECTLSFAAGESDSRKVGREVRS
jgi:hypothetical protein